MIPTPNADNTGEDLVNTLKFFGINVDYQEQLSVQLFYRVKLKTHAGVKVSSILRLSNDCVLLILLIAPQAGYQC